VSILLQAIAEALGVKFPEPPIPGQHMTAREAQRFIHMTGGAMTMDMIRNIVTED